SSMSMADSRVPVGLAMPWPAMSGAEPCTDSKYAQPPSPKLPDGATPSPPATSPATSERMSPYWFMHTTTSRVFGNRKIETATEAVADIRQRALRVRKVALAARIDALRVLTDDDEIDALGIGERRAHARVKFRRPHAGPCVHLPAQPADDARRRGPRGAKEHGVGVTADALRLVRDR